MEGFQLVARCPFSIQRAVSISKREKGGHLRPDFGVVTAAETHVCVSSITELMGVRSGGGTRPPPKKVLREKNNSPPEQGMQKGKRGGGGGGGAGAQRKVSE